MLLSGYLVSISMTQQKKRMGFYRLHMLLIGLGKLLYICERKQPDKPYAKR